MSTLGKHWKLSDESKKKHSISMMGKLLGRRLSADTIEKIRKSSTGRVSQLKGRKLSEEHKRKVSEALKGRQSWIKGKKNPKHSELMKGRPWSEARRKAQKPKKPTIRDGREYDPEWTNIRKKIYVRDNFICQECGCKCLDRRYKNTKNKIQCHHIDYDTTNNNPKNLITLCASCHAKTNFKKMHWCEYYNLKTENRLITV